MKKLCFTCVVLLLLTASALFLLRFPDFGAQGGQPSSEEDATRPQDLPENPDPEDSFYQVPIEEGDAVYTRIYGTSLPADASLELSELRYVHVLHADAEGVIHEGELIVNRAIAEDVLKIFRTLYEERYPIEKMRLIDDYDADDERSMSDNNTSAFNYRLIKGTDRLSRHALGFAVDINPLYNPYVGKDAVQPAVAEAYADRSADFPYKLVEGDLCWTLFTEYGFTWGGAWESHKDYQHFERAE